MKLSKDKLLIISFVALIFLGGIITFTQQNTVPSKAAGNPVTISMSATQSSIPANQEQIVTVTINTGDPVKKISAFDVTFNATGNLSITGSTPPVAVGGGTVNVNEFVRTITNTQARLAYAFINPDAELASAMSFQIKVSGTATGTGSLSLDLTRSQVVGNIVANSYDLPTTLLPITFTIGTGGSTVAPTAPPGTPQIQVRVAPTTGTQALNAPFTVSLIIDGQQAGQKVSAFDIKLNANPAVLRINSVSEAVDEAGSTAKFTKLVNSFNPTTGEILLNYISIQPEATLPNSAKIDINVTGIANGIGTLAVSSAQVTGNIVQNAYVPVLTGGQFNVGNVTVTGTPIPTATITGNPFPTATVTGNPTPTGNQTPTPTPTIPTGKTVFNIKLKLQGITRQPQSQYNSMKVQVMVGKDGFLSAPQIGSFTADTAGVWSGIVAFNDVPAGTGYRVYIKGAKHLQKKLCEASPIETAAGTYRCAYGKITIQDGQNTFDFSKVYSMVGDLPNQDGVVDSYDTSYIKLNLGSSVASVLQIADLNLDGIVDTQDYSLVIASLSIKYDDL